jgi:hypothetical protein
MTPRSEVVFGGANRQVFTRRYDEFTFGNATVTVLHLDRAPLATFMTGSVQRIWPAPWVRVR